MANPGVALIKAICNEIRELKEILKSPYLVRKNLQANDVTPRVFYKEQECLIDVLQNTSSPTSTAIILSMNRREGKLPDSGMSLGEVYVDPMYQNTEQGTKIYCKNIVYWSGLQI